MHITRTDKGYRLECSETEWEIMELIVDCGMADLVDEEHRANVSPAAKRIFRKDRFTQILGPMTVDFDER
jgi:hypothetical protein